MRTNLIFALCLVGCGGSSDNNGSGDMAMSSSGDMAMSSSGDMAMSSSGDMTIVIPPCEATAACDVGEGSGLCKSGVCSTCTDVTDDAACQAVYGAGYLCIDSACAQADCRSTTDCGGRACNSGQCAPPCTSDADCDDAQVCNTTSGLCVTNASCGGAAVGAACPVNAADKCCTSGASTVCMAVDCCTNADCNGGLGCQNGRCVNTTNCAAPATAIRFVNSAATMPGNGTKACPYNKLEPALQDVRALGGGAVLAKLDSMFMSAMPRKLSDNIKLGAYDDNGMECTVAACPTARWPKYVNPGDKASLVVRGVNAGVKFFSFSRPMGAAMSFAPAIVVAEGASANLDQVSVQNHGIGALATKGSTVNIGPNSHFDNNLMGALANTGSTVNVMVPAMAMNATTFNNNVAIGIKAVGSARLTMNAPMTTAGSTRLVNVDGNGQGFHFYSSNTTRSTITNVSTNNNKGHGFNLLGGSRVSISGSQATGNTKSALNVAPNGTSLDSSQIDAPLATNGNEIPDQTIGQQ